MVGVASNTQTSGFNKEDVVQEVDEDDADSDESEVDPTKPQERPVEKNVEKIFKAAQIDKQEEADRNADLGIEDEDDIEMM